MNENIKVMNLDEVGDDLIEKRKKIAVLPNLHCLVAFILVFVGMRSFVRRGCIVRYRTAFFVC